MQLYPVPAFQDNYIWVLADGKNALVVDPGDAAPVIEYLDQHKLNVAAILITHHHLDHIGGLNTLVQTYGHIPIYGPKLNDIPFMTHPLVGGERLTIAPFNTEIQVLAVPGHTLGHIAFYLPATEQEPPYLFCGDTLFASGCGRLFEGTPLQMWASLSKLMQLPQNTLVCCAHEYTLSNIEFSLAVLPQDQKLIEYQARTEERRKQGRPSVPTTLADELKYNLFLKVNEPEVQHSVSNYLGKPVTNAVDVFAGLRQWKDNA